MEVLSRAKEKGIIRAHGVSCHTLDALKLAARTPWVEVDQARINPIQAHMDADPATVLGVLREMKAGGQGDHRDEDPGAGGDVRPGRPRRRLRGQAGRAGRLHHRLRFHRAVRPRSPPSSRRSRSPPNRRGAPGGRRGNSGRARRFSTWRGARRLPAPGASAGRFAAGSLCAPCAGRYQLSSAGRGRRAVAAHVGGGDFRPNPPAARPPLAASRSISRADSARGSFAAYRRSRAGAGASTVMLIGVWRPSGHKSGSRRAGREVGGRGGRTRPLDVNRNRAPARPATRS